MGAVKKILYVEDDLINQMIIKKMLEALGYEVQVAGTAKEALQILESSDNPIDIILTDLGLPDMHGIELVQKIRRSQFQAKDKPIIALTGDSKDKTKKETVAAGMNGFLMKPITLDILKEAFSKF